MKDKPTEQQLKEALHHAHGGLVICEVHARLQEYDVSIEALEEAQEKLQKARDLLEQLAETKRQDDKDRIGT